MKGWVDSCVDEKGEIHECDLGALDDIQPGILLYPLLDETGDERYKKALDTLLAAIKDFPRNEIGGFWHKVDCPEQMWLDGLYLGGPIAAEYGSRFHQPEFLDLVVKEALLMREKTRDEKNRIVVSCLGLCEEAGMGRSGNGTFFRILGQKHRLGSCGRAG